MPEEKKSSYMFGSSKGGESVQGDQVQGEQGSSPKHAMFRGDATSGGLEDASYREFVASGRALASTLYGDGDDDDAE